jgi:hypothetical protein
MRVGVPTAIVELSTMHFTPFSDRLRQHPRLAAWAALAVAMVVMLLFAAKDVPLLPSQLAALIVATIALAGLCVWIIHWE